MDDFKRSHVPAFGSWNSSSDDLPFTQCFEAARQAGLFPGYDYNYYEQEDRDLYLAGDLYGYDVVTPAVIVVPRRRTKSRYPHVKEAKSEVWAVKEPPSPVLSPPPARKASKPVDADLYKISPELLYAKAKRKRGWGFFSACLMPICAA